MGLSYRYGYVIPRQSPLFLNSYPRDAYLHLAMFGEYEGSQMHKATKEIQNIQTWYRDFRKHNPFHDPSKLPITPLHRVVDIHRNEYIPEISYITSLKENVEERKHRRQHLYKTKAIGHHNWTGHHILQPVSIHSSRGVILTHPSFVYSAMCCSITAGLTGVSR